MKNRGRKERTWLLRLRFGIVVQTLVVGLLIVGCASSSEQTAGAEAAADESDAPTDDDILYRAIVDVFEREELPVEIASEEKQIVVGPWRELNSEVRHRLMARVVRARAGLVLRVRSEYERLDRTADPPTWQPADDPLTTRKATREEQQLGQAIQKRFRDLRQR